ncbi:MAG: hypothetical protein FWD61_09220 [Phycisphaerales bacterium]|nr:hypothetical protein [Phycisphaerales bacterium]
MTKHILQTVLLLGILLTTNLIAFGQAAAKPTFKSPDAVAAVKAYEAAEAKAKADYEKAVATARTTAIKSLTAAMEKATKAGSLDEAVAIRDKIAELKAEEEAGTPKPFVAAIVGTWRDPGGDTWVFTEDGKFESRRWGANGTWTVTATALQITFTSTNHRGRVDTFQSRDGDTIKGKSSWGQAVTLKKDAEK